MTTYTAITAGEIDVDSPITTGLMTKIRDNPIAITEGASGAPKIQTAALAAGAVKQGNLSTTDEEDSTSTAAVFTTSAGKYGFTPIAKSTLLVPNDWVALAALDTVLVALIASYQSFLTLSDGGSGFTLYGQITYVNSSPPFDLGDGDIPLFVWALVNSAGLVESVQSSELPPWAYNGPTDIMPDRTDTASGRKFKKIYDIDEESGLLIESEIEITQELKNRDMPLIPHPFITKSSDQTVVLLDPVETGYLHDLKKGGQSINELLHNDYIRLDNTPLTRAAPQGVIPAGFKWKNSVKKAGEAVRDKRLKQGPYAPIPPEPPTPPAPPEEPETPEPPTPPKPPKEP